MKRINHRISITFKCSFLKFLEVFEMCSILVCKHITIVAVLVVLVLEKLAHLFE
jgi:hypothetical protein